jgi:hypothetical protein
MKIVSNVTLADFQSVMFLLARKQIAFYILPAIGFLYAFGALMQLSGLGNIPSGNKAVIQLLGSIFLIIAPFVSLRFQSKTNFSTNKRIQETITFEFSEENIKIVGESFTSALTWEKVYKVVETKEWFLIYESSQTLHLVGKRFFSTKDLGNFQELLKQIPNLKLK